MKQAKQLMILLLCIVLTAASAGKGAAQTRRPLSHEDYDSWKSITNSCLSFDGRWLCYVETPQDGEADLVAVHLEKGTEYRQTVGYTGEGTDAEREAKPRFSPSSTHLVFLVSPTQALADSAKKAKIKENKKKTPKKLCILSLSDGSASLIDSVKSFQMPEKTGDWVAFLKEPQEKKKEEKEKKEGEEKKEEEKEEKEEDRKKEKKKDYGTLLVYRDLATDTVRSFSDVLEFTVPGNGRFLFFTVSSKEKPETDGVYSHAPETGETAPLMTGKGDYKRFTLNKEEDRCAFLSDRDDYESEEPLYLLYGSKTGEAAALWVSHKETRGFPEGMAVSDKSPLKFSEDGSVLLFGIKEIPEPEKEDEEEKPNFDLWHWNDPYPQPQQKKMAKEVRDNTWESVYHVRSGKFVKLADQEIPDVELSRDGKVAWAQTPWPYTKLVSHDDTYVDVYTVDVMNGTRTPVKKKLGGRAVLSPDEKYISWFEKGDWYLYCIGKGWTRNLTGSLDVSFAREDWDTPSPPASYGYAGWTEKDRSLLIYDRFDIWEIAPDGKARMITEGAGRKNSISFRYVRLDPEERALDPEQPILLSATDENTMATGFYRDTVSGSGEPVRLIMEDRRFGRPEKARDADVLLFTRSAFHEFPDLWVSGPGLSDKRRVTDLGAQTDPFLWGKAELVDFLNEDLKPLKGILVKPENFDPSRKYPLMIYIYETLHTMHHFFYQPGPGTSVNFPTYVSNGYVLWMPDIEYGTGYPGRDALKCVLPGIQMLIHKGFIDTAAVGIQGHSWGGYQIAYMVTQTHVFAAAEAGAPVSNMISAYGGIRWGSGMVRQFQYERTQSRLGASLWEVPMRYIENSPIFWADKVKTPLLMVHNDEDGAVPWYQGIEYMMALRRLGREAYLLNYNGEDHGLRKRINQKDWSLRMQQFFDHHLKGAPAPDWMTDGIQAWEKEEEKGKSE